MVAVFDLSVTTQFQALAHVALAMVLGAAVGWERSRAFKAAGMRTNTLVAGAAAMLTLLGESAVGEGGDATRVIQGVIQGVGFIGAGTIVHSRNGEAAGLTTAATVFFVAAVGMAVGLGLPVFAAGATALVLLTLRGLKKVEAATTRRGRTAAYGPAAAAEAGVDDLDDAS